MPERDKQVDAMARTIAGAPSRSFRTRLGDQPTEITEQEWDAAQTTADRVYVDMVENIDFQRVLIEANKRHLTIHPDKHTWLAAADIGTLVVETICHECITEVLLATSTQPSWADEPESPRYLRYDPTNGHGPLDTPRTLDPFEAVGGSPMADDDWDEDDD